MSELFPNGMAYDCWLDNNCYRCRKGPELIDTLKDGTNPACEIETEISIAACLDGKIRPEKEASIAKRLNWSGNEYLTGHCPELEPIE